MLISERMVTSRSGTETSLLPARCLPSEISMSSARRSVAAVDERCGSMPQRARSPSSGRTASKRCYSCSSLQVRFPSDFFTFTFTPRMACQFIPVNIVYEYVSTSPRSERRTETDSRPRNKRPSGFTDPRLRGRHRRRVFRTSRRSDIPRLRSITTVPLDDRLTGS